MSFGPTSESGERQERFLALLNPVYPRLERFCFAMESDRDQAYDLIGPVESIALLRLKLNEPRIVAVSLHGIMGNRLGVLQGDRRLEAGESSLQLLFDEIPSGIYLLAIGTDRGELEIVRIMLK